MRPLRVGLTGNIGSGKSTVAQLLVKRGAVLIDSDALAKEATDDPEVLAAIADTLGHDLIVGGKLDRAATAKLIFSNFNARQKLNHIVHPWVRRELRKRAEALEDQDDPPEVILLDIPLLYENSLENTVDFVIVVDATLATRTARVMERSQLREDEVRARDAAQMPLEDKVKRADFVINNDDHLESLLPQVDWLWRELLRRHQLLQSPS